MTLFDSQILLSLGFAKRSASQMQNSLVKQSVTFDPNKTIYYLIDSFVIHGYIIENINADRPIKIERQLMFSR